MADRYWDGGTDTDPTDANNWSDTDGGATPASSVPGTGDHAHFTANGDGNACTSTAATWLLGDLTFLAGYTSKFDLAASNMTMDDGGNITLDGGGEFDMGTGTIRLTNGNFDNTDQTTCTIGTSKLSMSGTGSLACKIGVSNHLYNLTIETGAVISQTDVVETYGIALINGSLSIANTEILYISGASDLQIGANGTLTGLGEVRVNHPGSGEGITAFATGGTIDIATLSILNPHAEAVLEEGTYKSALVKVYSSNAAVRTMTLDGDYIFEGNLELENVDVGGEMVLKNDTYDPNITVQGNIISDKQNGTLTWTAGTGTLTASGGNAQNWDLLDATVEKIVVNKSAGTLTFTDGWTAASFAGTAGTVDFNEETFETTGDFTITGVAMASPTTGMTGVDITVGGNFKVNNCVLVAEVGDECTINVNGTTATAHNVNVDYCDASGGSVTPIIAYNSTDGGHNTDWTFIVTGGGFTGFGGLTGLNMQ